MGGFLYLALSVICSANATPPEGRGFIRPRVRRIALDKYEESAIIKTEKGVADKRLARGLEAKENL